MTVPTKQQRSAGGVIFRRHGSGAQIALIAVGEELRWQLPKGLIEPGELPELTAIRETREESGLEGELVAPLQVVEYWYYGTEGKGKSAMRVRYHKFVHFYLLAYQAGNVEAHDHEVVEARWVALEDAAAMMAFASERRVVEEAVQLLA